jgi:formylmethanofuran dehydrogenase subunit E
MEEILKKIKEFHGHLGPFVVIGYKMGEISKIKLGKNPFHKKAIIWTGNKTPLSCIIDGIQLSSGCTLGKGNINIKNKRIPKAKFINDNGRKIEIILKKEIFDEIQNIDGMKNLEDYSKTIFNKSYDELFEII